jgi:D-alanine transaminase
LAADEAFTASSVREVLPIVAVDGRPLGAGRPGPVTRALQGAYRELVKKALPAAGPPAV